MKKHTRLITFTATLISLATLTACIRDVDNQYKAPRYAAEGAAAGGLAGLAYSSTTGATPAAATTILGAAIGGGAGYFSQSKSGSLVRLMGSPGVQVIPYGEEMRLVFDSDLLFEPTTSNIRYESYNTLLDAVGVLTAFKRGDVTISAYGDAVGNEQRGYELTREQAHSVLSFFWSHGIPHRRMRALGYGRYVTVASNKTSFGSSFNRRVEVSIKPPIA